MKALLLWISGTLVLLLRRLRSASVASPRTMRLQPGSRVAVIGGGPAGSFFSYFFLEMAARIGLHVDVDIYEPKTYTAPGPGCCNMCGGVVSESLIQCLAAEGINLPSTVVQRGIDSYVLHMDVGSVRIDVPGEEKRIAAVHRGCGPRGAIRHRWESFDGHLLKLAAEKGARVIPERVQNLAWVEGRPRVTTGRGVVVDYDLLVSAVGVKGPGIKLFERLDVGFTPPKTQRTFICEFLLGEEVVAEYLGNSMHVFLLNIPRLEFAALIPKGEHATVVILGKEVDKEMVTAFLSAPEVMRCFPPGWTPPENYCRCCPSINVQGSPQPYFDRLVFVGDCGESRLYKDGIGGAYLTAKSAAKTAIFEGVSKDAFREHYGRVCRALASDNAKGKLIFRLIRLVNRVRWTRNGILRMAAGERGRLMGARRMSRVLWDTFTGSAPYRDVLARMLDPRLTGRFLLATFAGLVPEPWRATQEKHHTTLGELGRIYRAGETIVQQGDAGDCMYVIQAGKVEVIREYEGREIQLAELGEGEIFGEMALFDGGTRSATVRPVGEVRVLSIDRNLFLRKVHEDPSLTFPMVQKMIDRIRHLDEELTKQPIRSGKTPTLVN